MAAPASSNVIGIHTAQWASSTTVRPLAGVFETLATQHRQVLDLLRRARAASSAAKRGALWADARRELLSHERAEELAVYVTLEGYDAAQVLLEQHGEQSAQLELAIADLDATDCDTLDWIEQLSDMMALLEEHIRDEETEFFPRAQELLGENTARELEDPFATAQREVRDTLA
jgi:hemerythrin-like domain-containing protein